MKPESFTAFQILQGFTGDFLELNLHVDNPRYYALKGRVIIKC